MAYPAAINSRIKVPNNITDRDIADCNGFDVVSADGCSFTMVRRRPVGCTFLGQQEFLALLPDSRVSQAEAAMKVIS